MYSDNNNIKIRTMWVTLCFTLIITGVKFVAYFITNSNAVLSDALECLINVIAGSFALYSILYAAKPKDEDHPYGHGKMENVSAGFEGALVFIAGIATISKAIYNFFNPEIISNLDIGVYLTVFSGFGNYFIGTYLIKKGKQYHSSLMTADGKHLLTDTFSSIALVAGLIIIHFTHLIWLDNVLAIILGLVILRTGYHLIKESVDSLLDEADSETIDKMIKILNTNRKVKWIDMHNLRILKYGSFLHLDCHVTLPWYDNLEETHKEIHAIENLINKNMEGRVESFIHSDPCVPDSCPICLIENCKVRQHPFIKKLEWTTANLLPNHKHNINDN